jgi:PIN domain nuclease of toxin-antitoxin system
VILFDTQCWIWLAKGSNKMSKRAKSAAIRAAKSRSGRISAYSLWEAAWLHRKQRIQISDPLDVWLASLVADTWVAVEPLSERICLAAAMFPLDFPSDPGDRLVAATARVLACPLVSADERIRAANVVETIW